MAFLFFSSSAIAHSTTVIVVSTPALYNSCKNQNTKLAKLVIKKRNTEFKRNKNNKKRDFLFLFFIFAYNNQLIDLVIFELVLEHGIDEISFSYGIIIAETLSSFFDNMDPFTVDLHHTLDGGFL